MGRVGNAQSIADRISGSRKTTRMWQELAERESELIGFHTDVYMLPEYYTHLQAFRQRNAHVVFIFTVTSLQLPRGRESR